MNIESELTYEQALKLADDIVLKVTAKHLSDIELEVFKGSWEGKRYEEIAQQLHVTTEHVNNNVGYGLWQKLSKGLGETITKRSFRLPLQREWEKRFLSQEALLTRTLPLEPEIDNHLQQAGWQDSDFYIVERPQEEERCYGEVLKPGCLLRIKAPWQTGKTLLMSKILHYVAQHNYRTVALNVRDAEPTDFMHLDNFLQWFCTTTAVMLELEQPVDEHWRKSIGNNKTKCRSYFEKYVLLGDNPLVLALDEVDRIFPYQEIASEFLGILRTWHEDAKVRPLWRQMRLVVLHSEIYKEVDINQSPFNAGYELVLTDFNQKQVLALAQRHGLPWAQTQVTELMEMVGGHPYLVSQALLVLVRKDINLEELLQTAPTASGIYHRHLERHWKNLRENKELAIAFKKVVFASMPIGFDCELNQDVGKKLSDLGLVKIDNRRVTPSYELYRLYFSDRFAVDA